MQGPQRLPKPKQPLRFRLLLKYSCAGHNNNSIRCGADSHRQQHTNSSPRTPHPNQTHNRHLPCSLRHRLKRHNRTSTHITRPSTPQNTHPHRHLLTITRRNHLHPTFPLCHPYWHPHPPHTRHPSTLAPKRSLRVPQRAHHPLPLQQGKRFVRPKRSQSTRDPPLAPRRHNPLHRSPQPPTATRRGHNAYPPRQRSYHLRPQPTFTHKKKHHPLQHSTSHTTTNTITQLNTHLSNPTN